MERWDGGLAASRGCAHLSATVQLLPVHPGIQAAAEHKEHLRGRLAELCAATGATDPDDGTHDLLLIYEGTHNTWALRGDPDLIEGVRRFATLCLRLSV